MSNLAVVTVLLIANIKSTSLIRSCVILFFFFVRLLSHTFSMKLTSRVSWLSTKHAAKNSKSELLSCSSNCSSGSFRRFIFSRRNACSLRSLPPRVPWRVERQKWGFVGMEQKFLFLFFFQNLPIFRHAVQRC